jgi:hypothetical protein
MKTTMIWHRKLLWLNVGTSMDVMFSEGKHLGPWVHRCMVYIRPDGKAFIVDWTGVV